MSQFDRAATRTPELVKAQLLQGSGLKIDFSDGTCVFLDAEDILAASPVRFQNSTWPADKLLNYCCYDGCEFCS